MTIGNAISTAVSGLQANAQRAAVAADNIANVTTPGFIPADLVSASVVAGGRGSGVRTSLRPAVLISSDAFEMSQVNVAGEFARLMQARTAYRAGVHLIRTSDQMARSTINELA